MDTGSIRITPHYGQFALSLGKKAFMAMLKRQGRLNEGRLPWSSATVKEL